MWPGKKKLKAGPRPGQAIGTRLERQSIKRPARAGQGAVALAWRGLFAPVGKVALMLGLTALLLLSAYAGLSRASWFELRQVEITGASHLSRLDILSAAGLGMHTNLLSLKPAQAEAGIRELPWIDQVKVERGLPDRIKINVSEHAPYAIGLIEGELFYLNRFLKPFAPFAYDQPPDLPVVSGLSRAELMDEDEDLEELLRRGREILSLLSKEADPAWGMVSQLDLSREDGIKLVFDKIPATIKVNLDFNEFGLSALRRAINDLRQRGELSRALLLDMTGDKQLIVRLGQERI